MDQLDPNLTKQHYKASLFRAYILYIKKNYPNINISKLCENAGLPLEYLLNDNHWVSIEFESRFMCEIKKHIHDPKFVMEVGKFGVSPEVFGRVLHYLIKNLVSLNTVYNKLPYFTSLLNKAAVLTVTSHTKNNVRYQIEPNTKILNAHEIELYKSGLKDFIDNLTGYYSATAREFGLKPATVESKYDTLSVQMSINYPSNTLSTSTIFYFVTTAIFMATVVLFASGSAFFNYSIVGLILWVVLAQAKKYKTAYDVAIAAEDNLFKLDEQYKTLNDTKTSLARQLQEANAIRRVVDVLIEARDETDILENACKTIVKSLNYDRAIILLANKILSDLKYKSSFGLNDSLKAQIVNFKLDVNIESSDPHKLSNVFRLGLPILIEDVESHLPSLRDAASAALLKLSQSKSFLCVPIQTEKNKIGVLIVDCNTSGKQLNKLDVKILSLVGNQIAIAIERGRAQSELITALDEQKKLSDAYSKFVPHETLSFLGYKNIFDVHIGDGVERNLTILFSDIRSFSSLCESMSPAETLKFLNSYFGRISPIILKNNGVVDKFIGDCVMAIFNNPSEALRAGVEIQREIVKYNLTHRVGGRRYIEAGIGICTGPVVMGPLGSEDKTEITVLSDVVNIASRLDGLCPNLGAKILISGLSCDFSLMREGCFEIDHGEQPLKGKDRFVRVTEVVDTTLIQLTEELSKGDVAISKEYLKNINEYFQKKNVSLKLKRNIA